MRNYAKIEKQPHFCVNNCVAALVGILVGCTMNAAPYGFQIPFMMNLATKIPSSMIAMVAGIVACVVVNKIHPVKK